MKAPRNGTGSSLDIPTRRKMREVIQTHCLTETLDDSIANSNVNSSVSPSSFTIHQQLVLYPFSRLIILLTLSLVKDNFMDISMIFFIVRATNDCNFKAYIGRSVACIAISQLIAFPLLSWITDFNSKHISVIFIVSVFVQLLLETAMIFESTWSLNEVIFLHVLRQLSHTINTNAMYKMLKIKLLYWLRTCYTQSLEQKYFQTVCMIVITIHSVINMLCWSIFWYLSSHNMAGSVIQTLIFSYTLIFTLATQLFALLITSKYLKEMRDDHTIHTIRAMRPSNIVTLQDIERRLYTDRLEMDADYIQSGLRNIYANKLCFESVVSSMYLMLFLTICEFVFPLFFATQNEIPNDTIQTLCGGSIAVIIQYQVFGFILYFFGALVFLYVSKNIEAKLYFHTFIPTFCYVSIVLIFPLYFYNWFSLWNQFTVIFLAVIPQFLVKYNLFYSTACVDQQFVGMLLSIHTNLSTLTPLLSGLLLSLNVNIRVVLSLAIVLLIGTAFHSKSFSTKYF
eukprot:217733_1